ncbi:MAG TPA: hypothetical protein VGF31_02955, partial [Myxococcaceae bacterium]
DAGVISDFVASVLPEGTYDVTVELGDGRLSTATGAFHVTTGEWPVGFTIGMIGDQTSGVPFGVTLRAQGGTDGGYIGTVTLSVPSGATISPSISGPFSAGLRVETVTVTVDHPGNYHIDVSDLGGRTGRSLDFHVDQ